MRQEARALGFDKVGFAAATGIDEEHRLRRWLDRGFGAEMDYMERTAEARVDPRKIMEEARSVVALAVSYHHPEAEPTPPFKVSRYTMGRDYHRVIQKMLRKLRKKLLDIEPSAKVHPSVDTSAVLERAWAARAGITWTGKSTMAIATDLGTYTFLATLITDVEFVYDEPHPNRCGSCTQCLEACPTQAFVAPFELDARRCISYWTLEKHSGFTSDTPLLHGWIAGCDVCQEVCPWNKFAKATIHPALEPQPSLRTPEPGLLLAPERDHELSTLIANTALKRTGSAALRKNALRVLAETSREPGDSPERHD